MIGAPTTITSPQTYRVILTTPYGADTTFFSFQVTPTNGVSNTPGTGSSAAQQNDGLMVKYIDFSNCEKLIDIADSLGGTSPGQTTVTQTVYPLVSVIAGDSLIRRATQINADNIDTLKVNATFYLYLSGYSIIQANNWFNTFQRYYRWNNANSCTTNARFT